MLARQEESDQVKRGRPRKLIDVKQLNRLASIGCSMGEMAHVLGVSIDTLECNFAVVIKKGQAVGNISLRHKQFETAMQGNVTMLIWLGKQRLVQSDKGIAQHRDTSMEE
jgi:hypothetical protein